MPVTESLENHDLFGPVFKKGLEQGRLEARQELSKEGALRILRVAIEKRFGPMPQSLAERLAGFSKADRLAFCDRIVDAGSLEDLLK